MFPRWIIFAGASVLLSLLISFFGYRLYCGPCSKESVNEQFAIATCPPSTQIVSQEDILDLSSKLLRCDRYTEHKEIAALVTAIRKTGTNSIITSEILSSMLSYQAEIYQDRDKWEVLRLRSYLLLTLGEIGLPDSAIPMLEDALAYVDERMSVVEVGSAINAVGNLGLQGSRFGESIIGAYNMTFSDEEFSLKRYGVEFSKGEATTVKIEVVRSLGKICNNKDDYAVKFLHSILVSSHDFGVDKRVVPEAQRSLDMILQRKSGRGALMNLSRFCPCENVTQSIEMPPILSGIEHSPYIEAKDRKEVTNTNIFLKDHNGLKREFADLIDRPTLLTFFYTSCQNDNKCSATISQLSSLQNHLNNLSLGSKIRLVAITFEPEHDSPDLLKRYLTDRGVKLGSEAMAIKLETIGHQNLLNELMIPVGYNSSWVNGHGIEAVLLDKDKRIVRKYKSLFWDTSALLVDFTKLLKEDNSS